jgi:hypothetical protein
VMFAVGAITYVAGFGSYDPDNLQLLVVWIVCSVSLLGATAISGYFCRKNFQPVYYALWMLLWVPVAMAACMAVVAVIVVVSQSGFSPGPAESMVMVLALMFSSLMMSGMLYVFNLPVMILTMFSPCYQERFRNMFCKNTPESGSVSNE